MNSKNPPTYIHLTKEHLWELFTQAKSYNQTLSQFEENKSLRIKALAKAFIETKEPNLLERLNEVCLTEYKPKELL